MAEFLDITFEGDKTVVRGEANNIVDMEKIKHLLKKAVDDIADAVETESKRLAPVETGALKLHPVDRDDTSVGFTQGMFDVGFGQPTGIALFGGGFAVRGPGGRFISPQMYRSPIFVSDQLIAKSTITVAKEPKHAIWVHDGTGIYGPKHTIITAHTPGQRMKFPRWSKAIDRRPQWRLESVKGQRPQPYLFDAFELIDKTYVPMRLEILRAEIAAET
jgi:hypothetical protein